MLKHKIKTTAKQNEQDWRYPHTTWTQDPSHWDKSILFFKKVLNVHIKIRHVGWEKYIQS